MTALYDDPGWFASVMVQTAHHLAALDDKEQRIAHARDVFAWMKAELKMDPHFKRRVPKGGNVDEVATAVADRIIIEATRQASGLINTMPPAGHA